MRILRTIIGPAAAVLIAAAGATAALAGSPGLAIWKQQAGAQVSAEMRYPHSSRGRSASYNTVDLLIARDGRVVEAALVRKGAHPFDRSTERWVSGLERLPALPSDYPHEQALVRVHLIYAGSSEEVARLTKAIERSRPKQPAVRIQKAATLPTIELAAAAR